MAESCASDGPAAEAMNALVKNKPMSKNIIDDICKGKVVAEKSDLVRAIRIGCDYWMTDPTVKQNPILGPTRDSVKAWHDTTMNDIELYTHKYLQTYFRDLCTVTEIMVEKAMKHGGEEHIQELLHGRPEVQNQPSKYQLQSKVFFGDQS
jgi:hypothetical protein